ncbi:MAG: ATP-binding protein [Acidobacteriota bacterium]|nr:ATP-binding protein [Acidobacteriota bacterium]
MRFSIKQKQVLGVTAMVALIVTALSLLHLVTLARVLLGESRARAELMATAVYLQAANVVSNREAAADELRSSRSVQSALDVATYSPNVVDAVIVDAGNAVLASSIPDQVGRVVPARVPLDNILTANWLTQLRSIYAAEQFFEFSQPIALGDEPFGEIRISLWMQFVRDDLADSLAPAALAAGVSLLVAVVVAMLLAQLVLRPMHVIRSSLTRLGRGDLGATLDLRDDEELRDLGDVFDQVSAQLRAASPGGLSPAQLGEMSRRITRVGRLFTGVAHEMKNPLNAMTIHIELLRAKLDAASPAFPHLDVIAGEIRKLDDRIQGFLKFVRPEEVSFGPVPLAPLIRNVLAAVGPEADRAGVTVHAGCSDPALLAEGDAAQLRGVFLNLAQNAIQAMPKGGRLSMVCSALPDHRVSVRVEDTGVGIAPENLERIFELYFTTKDRGSGMGLALVFRAVQIHNGSIDVESTVGVGTAFIVVLPAA